MSDDTDGVAPSNVGYATREPFAPRERMPRLHRVFPVVRSVGAHRSKLLRTDLVAGLTVGALALPSGMAFAELAGLPPVVGLYSLLLPTVAYTLFGSSRQLIVGPEGTTATLTAAALAPLAAVGSPEYLSLALSLSVLVGLIFAVVWILRLGWVADYFARAVLIGEAMAVAALVSGAVWSGTERVVDVGPGPTGDAQFGAIRAEVELQVNVALAGAIFYPAYRHGSFSMSAARMVANVRKELEKSRKRSK